MTAKGQLMGMKEIWNRARRYTRVYYWLATQNARQAPRLFLALLLASVGGRLATLAGLITCAHLLSHFLISRREFHLLGYNIHLSQDEIKFLTVIVPVGLLLTGAALQRWSTLLRQRLTSNIGKSLGERYLEADGRKNLGNAGVFAIFETLAHSQFHFLNVLANATQLVVIVGACSVVVGPLAASIVLLGLGGFSGLFLAIRQRQSHALQARLIQRRAEIIPFLKSASSDRDQTRDRASNISAIANYAHEKFYSWVTFKERSIFAGLLVQAFVIFSLIVYVSTLPSTQALDIARIISLFVVLRFAVGLVQGINQSAIAISPDYPVLYRMAEGLDSAAPEDFDEKGNVHV